MLACAVCAVPGSVVLALAGTADASPGAALLCSGQLGASALVNSIGSGVAGLLAFASFAAVFSLEACLALFAGDVVCCGALFLLPLMSVNSSAGAAPPDVAGFGTHLPSCLGVPVCGAAGSGTTPCVAGVPVCGAAGSGTTPCVAGVHVCGAAGSVTSPCAAGVPVGGAAGYGTSPCVAGVPVGGAAGCGTLPCVAGCGGTFNAAGSGCAFTGVGISVAVRLYRTVLGVRGGGVPSCSCVYGPPFPHPSSLGIRARDCELTT